MASRRQRTLPQGAQRGAARPRVLPRRCRAAAARRPQAAPWLSTLATLVLLLGCRPTIGPAAFRARPDAARRGLPLGPFFGRVVDADSGRPIEGARVLCSWGFAQGLGTPAPAAARAQSTRTDPDGTYRIAELTALPHGLSTRLSRVSLVVYHPEYVAYRSDFEFQPRLHRRDFSQLGNVVRLTRWRGDLSHARHLLFLGGDAEVRRAAARELASAALELDQPALAAPALSGAPPALAPAPSSRPAAPALAALLLDADDVRAVTGYSGAFAADALADAGDATDSLHLQAVDRSEGYDVALRLWRRAPDDLIVKLEGLREELPAGRPVSGLGDRAFAVAQGEILGVAVFAASHAALLLLTCGRSQCTSEAQLLDLARRVIDHLPRLPRWTAPTAPDPSAESPGE